MEKINTSTPDLTQENIAKLAEIFPDVVTESVDSEGKLSLSVDFDALQEDLSVDACLSSYPKERYQFTWPGKREAKLEARRPINKTLKPCPEKSVDWDTTENIYIEGDNLEALKLLKNTYYNKIKLIYVDPPYNTGTDLLYMNDYSISQGNFESLDGSRDEEGNIVFENTISNGRFHSDWCSMMYARVMHARQLLREDGFFAVSIDHNELFDLGHICDEVFGEENRIGIISVVHKPEGRNQAKFIGPSNEYLLIYAKNTKIAKIRKVVLDPKISEKYDMQDDNGKYRLQNFIRLTDGKLAYRDKRPKFWYPIYINSKNNQISLTQDFGCDGTAVYPVTKSGIEMSWKVLPDTAQTLIKQGSLTADVDSDGFITINEKIRETQVIKTHWIRKEYNAIQYGTKVITELLGQNIFDFPKSVYLIEDILKLFTEKDDIVLDFFSGSATTAHALMQLNLEDGFSRKYILVQIPASCGDGTTANKSGYSNLCEIGQDRIRKAGKKIRDEFSNVYQTTLFDKPNKLPDLGFRVFEVADSNLKDIAEEPCLFEQNMLDLDIDNLKKAQIILIYFMRYFLNSGLNIRLML